MASEWKVRLSCFGEEIVFEASATIGESRNSSWDGYSITHLPTSILSYRYTSGRKLTVQGKLVSRDADEATTNSHYLDLIRSWILPDFGNTGATPPICRLSAYGNPNVQDLPVIVENYGWTFPEDVDYIFTGSFPMPVIGNLTVDLQEIYSAQEITDRLWEIKIDGQSSLSSSLVANTASAFLQSLGFLGSTPSVSSIASLGTGFAGLMSGALGGSSSGGQSGIMSNPNFGSLSGVSNSPEISSSSTSTSVTNNPYVSGILPGELSGVPQAPLSSPAPSPVDGFNRGDFSIDEPTLG